MDRRTFLTSAPRQLLSGVKALMSDVTAFAWPVAERRAHATPCRVALLDVSRCLAWGGSACQLCYLQCPLRDEAITLDDGRPLIMASACNGCGVCVEACRTVNDLGAIRLMSALVSTEQGGAGFTRVTSARQ